MEVFAQYSPLSWVVAGFLGLITSVAAFAVFSWAYGRWIRSKYNSYLYARSGYVDPMAKTFENKRIFLNEFCLPSEPYIQGKAFINCDIVGPANLILRFNNQLADQLLPVCDAVLIRPDASPLNGIIMDNCTFRGCSFKRISILVPQHTYPDFAQLSWLRWLNIEDDEPQLPGIDATPDEETVSLSPPSTEAETQP